MPTALTSPSREKVITLAIEEALRRAGFKELVGCQISTWPPTICLTYPDGEVYQIIVSRLQL